jgi:hypothetical protein
MVQLTSLGLLTAARYHSLVQVQQVQMLVAPKGSSCCNIILTLNYKIPVTTGTGTNAVTNNVAQTALTKTIRLMPFLLAKQNGNPVSEVYPGETYIIEEKFGGSCVSVYNCNPAPSYLWTLNGASCLSSCNQNNMSILVPSSGFGSNITVDETYDCGAFSETLEQLNLPVKLRDPSFVSFVSSIGCPGSATLTSSSVTYSTSPIVGAAYYVWTWPGTMFSPTFPTVINSSSIALDPIGIGTGSISVQAFDSNSLSISSNLLVSPEVSICCLPINNLSGIVDNSNSPYTQEAELKIYTINDIISSGSATIHAGIEVQLQPGFNAISGSQVHIYNDGCSGSYYRSLPHHDTSNIILPLNTINVTGDSDTDTQSAEHSTDAKIAKNNSPELKNENNFNEFSILVTPNPSTGEFHYQCSLSKDLKNLYLLNTFGQIITEYPNPSNKGSINLTNLSDGIYLLKFEFNDRINFKKIIKNNKY